MAHFEKTPDGYTITNAGQTVTLSAEQAYNLIVWLDQYRDEMFQTVHREAKQGIEEPQTVKRCDYCHKEVDQLYDLTPAAMGDITPIHVCHECYEKVVHELEQEHPNP
jgi:hypothetical protein